MSNSYAESPDAYNQGGNSSGAPMLVIQNDAYSGDAVIDASKTAIVQFTNFISGNLNIKLANAKKGVVLDIILFCGAYSPTIQVSSPALDLFLSQLGTTSASYGYTITPFIMNINTNRGIRVYIYTDNAAAVGID